MFLSACCITMQIMLTIPKIAKQQQTKMIEIYHAFLRKEDIERDYLNKLREQKSYLLSKMFI